MKIASVGFIGRMARVEWIEDVDGWPVTHVIHRDEFMVPPELEPILEANSQIEGAEGFAANRALLLAEWEKWRQG